VFIVAREWQRRRRRGGGTGRGVVNIMRMPERLYYIIYNKNCRCSRWCGGGCRTRGDLCIFYHYLPSHKTFPGTDSRRAFHFSTPSPTTCLHNVSRPRPPHHAAHSRLSHTFSISNSLPYFFLRHAFDPAASSMLFIQRNQKCTILFFF